MVEDSFLRYLVFFTTACSLIWVQEIQAQNSSVFISQPMSSSSSMAASYSVFPSASVTSTPPSQNQSSSIFLSKSTVLTVQSTKLTSQVTSSPIPVRQTTTRSISSTMSQPSSAVKHSTSTTSVQHSTPATSVPTSRPTSDPLLSTTEWILVACLGVFGIILITLAILAVQVSRLNKTVQKLKAAPVF